MRKRLTLANGENGPCFDAISGAALAAGSLMVSLLIPAGCTPGMYVLEVTGAAGQLLQNKLLKR